VVLSLELFQLKLCMYFSSPHGSYISHITVTILCVLNVAIIRVSRLSNSHVSWCQEQLESCMAEFCVLKMEIKLYL
jgi:hypothetical protein